MRLVKLFLFNFVCAKTILHKYFDENLLDEIKTNYSTKYVQHNSLVSDVFQMMLTLLPQPSLETGRDVHVDTHNHHTITLYVHYYRFVEQTNRQTDCMTDRQTD